MALEVKVNHKRNEEYWSLKARIDKWGVWVWIVYPSFAGITLVFGGAATGHNLYPEGGAFLGFLLGGLAWQASTLILVYKKIGFIVESSEQCQSCKIPMAKSVVSGFPQLDYLCRRCGNNNSVKLDSFTETTNAYSRKKFPEVGNIFTRIKNQTYIKASKRIAIATKLYFRFFSPLILIAMTTFIYRLNINGETENTVKHFFILWCFIAVTVTSFLFSTRDIISHVFNGLYDLPRIFLGSKHSRNPFELSTENLPHYLKCDNCGTAAITQLRLSWEGLDICPNCGNDNRIDLHDA